MKKIPLTKGQYAIVDDEDFPYLNRFKWRAVDNKSGSFNVSTSISTENNTIYALPMWTLLTEQKVKMKMVFRDRNPLNHQKENLYLATPSEYCISQPKPIGEKRKPSSKYKGVCYRASQTRGNRYQAIIQKEGKVYSKRFKDEISAVKWYNEKAQELYGDIAYKNKI